MEEQKTKENTHNNMGDVEDPLFQGVKIKEKKKGEKKGEGKREGKQPHRAVEVVRTSDLRTLASPQFYFCQVLLTKIKKFKPEMELLQEFTDWLKEKYLHLVEFSGGEIATIKRKAQEMKDFEAQKNEENEEGEE